VTPQLLFDACTCSQHNSKAHSLHRKYIRLAIVYSNKLGSVLRFRNVVDVLTGALGEVLLAAVQSAPAAASTDRHRQAGSKYGAKRWNARLPGCQWQAPQLKHSSHSFVPPLSSSSDTAAAGLQPFFCRAGFVPNVTNAQSLVISKDVCCQVSSCCSNRAHGTVLRMACGTSGMSTSCCKWC
jgi:hypothetical protein